MKKFLSVMLSVCVLLYMFPFVASAGSKDIACGFWYGISPEPENDRKDQDCDVWEIFLKSRYITYADSISISTNSDIGDPLPKESYVVKTGSGGTTGCLVVYIRLESGTQEIFIAENSFFDAHGTSNSLIHLTKDDLNFKYNPIRVEGSSQLGGGSSSFFLSLMDIMIDDKCTFCFKDAFATVIYDGEICAADVQDSYTFQFTESGQHTVTVMMFDVAPVTFDKYVYSKEEVRKNRLSSVTKDILFSLLRAPLTFLMLLTPFTFWISIIRIANFIDGVSYFFELLFSK